MPDCFGIVAIVSIGWIVGAFDLTSFGPDYIPMAPLTAILFCLLSLTTITQITGTPRAVNRALCHIFLLVVGTLSILDLVDFGLSDPFDFERLLLPNPEAFGKVVVGRISPITSACFLLAVTASGFQPYFNGSRKSIIQRHPFHIGFLFDLCEHSVHLGLHLRGPPSLWWLNYSCWIVNCRSVDILGRSDYF